MPKRKDHNKWAEKALSLLKREVKGF